MRSLFLYKRLLIFYNCAMLEITSAKGAPAKKYKLKKGDKILAFDGFAAEDSLDYLFYDGKESFTMTVKRAGGEERVISVEKAEYESLNLTFKSADKIRTCRNSCLFCFVDQMRAGMRESLYVKDDDYTLSFMCGSFVTLTNLSEADMQRIIRLRLSPLYVSVHTVNQKLRVKLLGNRFAGNIVRQLKTLADAKITMHCQAVIVAGMNDGRDLEATAKKLFEMYPYVADLAVVPAGVTKFRTGLAQIPDITAESSAKILDLCDALNKKFGVNFLLPADEYFIRAGRAFKPYSFYGGFPQIENGIGVAAKFVAEAEGGIFKTKLKKPRKVAVVTGVSAHAVTQSVCEKANLAAENLHAFALAVKNDFFGETVTCTGLLTGRDIARALEENADGFDRAVIPADTLKEFEDVFLDDMTLKQLKRRIKGKNIIINPSAENFFASLIKG